MFPRHPRLYDTEFGYPIDWLDTSGPDSIDYIENHFKGGELLWISHDTAHHHHAVSPTLYDLAADPRRYLAESQN